MKTYGEYLYIYPTKINKELIYALEAGRGGGDGGWKSAAKLCERLIVGSCSVASLIKIK